MVTTAVSRPAHAGAGSPADSRPVGRIGIHSPVADVFGAAEVRSPTEAQCAELSRHAPSALDMWSQARWTGGGPNDWRPATTAVALSRVQTLRRPSPDRRAYPYEMVMLHHRAGSRGTSPLVVAQLAMGSAGRSQSRGLPSAIVLMRAIAKGKHSSQSAAQPDKAIHAHRRRECAFEPRDLTLVDARIVGKLALRHARQVATALDVLAESQQQRIWLPAETTGHRVAPAMRRRNEKARSRRHELSVIGRDVVVHDSRAAILLRVLRCHVGVIHVGIEALGVSRTITTGFTVNCGTAVGLGRPRFQSPAEPSTCSDRPQVQVDKFSRLGAYSGGSAHRARYSDEVRTTRARLPSRPAGPRRYGPRAVG